MPTLACLGDDILYIICRYLSFEDVLALRIVDRAHARTFSSDAIAKWMLWLFCDKKDGTRHDFDKIALSRRRLLLNKPTSYISHSNYAPAGDVYLCPAPSSNIIAYWTHRQDLILLNVVSNDIRHIAFNFNQQDMLASQFVVSDTYTETTRDVIPLKEDEARFVIADHERLTVCKLLPCRNKRCRHIQNTTWMFVVLSLSPDTFGDVLYHWSSGRVERSFMIEATSSPFMWVVNKHYLIGLQKNDTKAQFISIQEPNVKLSRVDKGMKVFQIDSPRVVMLGDEIQWPLYYNPAEKRCITDGLGEVFLYVDAWRVCMYDVRRIVDKHGAGGDRQQAQHVIDHPLLEWVPKDHTFLRWRGQHMLCHSSFIQVVKRSLHKSKLDAINISFVPFNYTRLDDDYWSNAWQSRMYTFTFPLSMAALRNFVMAKCTETTRLGEHGDTYRFHDNMHENTFLVNKIFYDDLARDQPDVSPYSWEDPKELQSKELVINPYLYNAAMSDVLRIPISRTHVPLQTTSTALSSHSKLFSNLEHRYLPCPPVTQTWTRGPPYDSAKFVPASMRKGQEEIRLTFNHILPVRHISRNIVSSSANQWVEIREKMKSKQDSRSSKGKDNRMTVVAKLSWPSPTMFNEATPWYRSRSEVRESLKQVWVGDGGAVSGGWILYVYERKIQGASIGLARNKVARTERNLVVVLYD